LGFVIWEVLQENIILHGIKRPQDESLVISTSAGRGDEFITERRVAATQLVQPNDSESFIRIVPDELNHEFTSPLAALTTKLGNLGLSVSTGCVVDFRVSELLVQEPEPLHIPLIYPHNLENGFVKWRNGKTRKPTALVLTPQSQKLLVPRGVYVLVKRFTAKEEARRIVAAVLNPERMDAAWYAFENHLNFYHDHERGLDLVLAKGLAAYLNSTIVDEFFRQFSGHTQVNATDLRSLNYPAQDELIAIGSAIRDEFPNQPELDELVLGVLKPARPINSPDTRYQIEPAFLKLVQSYGSDEWSHNLSLYLRSTNQLARLRARERKLEFVPVHLPDGARVNLSRGGQNPLVKEIVEQY